MKKPFLMLAAALLIGAGCVKPVSTTIPPPVAEAAPAPAALVREFVVTGANFKFDVPEIRVKQGEKVRITFKNAEGFHDLKIDEFGVATQKLSVGKEETVEFTADKTGTFKYYCSVGKHAAMGMIGNLIVE